MTDKKKTTASPEKQAHICYVCGREISGDHVCIRTKRHTELHIHNGCMPGKEKKDED